MVASIAISSWPWKRCSARWAAGRCCEDAFDESLLSIVDNHMILVPITLAYPFRRHLLFANTSGANTRKTIGRKNFIASDFKILSNQKNVWKNSSVLYWNLHVSETFSASKLSIVKKKVIILSVKYFMLNNVWQMWTSRDYSLSSYTILWRTGRLL